VEIVPVLVPCMDWERMDKSAGELSAVLAGLLKEKGWKLGEDTAIISYADFGTDIPGYQKAVRRDIHLSVRSFKSE